MRLSGQLVMSLIAIGFALSALYVVVTRTTPAATTQRQASVAAPARAAGADYAVIDMSCRDQDCGASA